MFEFTRSEDAALLQGQARFVADLRVRPCLEAAFVRSPYAHAKILGIDSAKALALPGVVGVFSAEDLPRTCRRLPSTARASTIHMLTDNVLAESESRYVGEPVAVVLAENRYVAEDAAELVDVDYKALSVCSRLDSALLPAAPSVHPHLGSNLVGEKLWETGDADYVLSKSELVVIYEQFRVHRGTSSPLEPRGLFAVPVNSRTEPYLLKIWASTQSPYRLRDSLAEMFGVSAGEISVKAESVGGGFGPKSGFYPEDFVVPWLARKTGVAVRWLEDRREHLLCARQERDQIHDVTVAFSPAGKILALKDEFVYDVGAYSTTVIIPWTTAYTLPGPYKIPNLKIRMRLAFTHKVPTMTVRGAGRPEAVFVMERMVDRIAQRLSMDPVEVRRINFVNPEDLPWNTGMTSRDGEEIVYESIDAPGALEKVIERLEYYKLRAQCEKENLTAIKKRGAAVASYVISTGRGPYEIARVRLESSGDIMIHTGSCPQGQGHHTMLAQICSRELGAPAKNVTVITGDTSLIHEGFGTFASRSAVTAGNSVAVASRLLVERLKERAAKALDHEMGQMKWENGWLVCGSRKFELGEIIALLDGYARESGAPSPFPLEATAKFETTGHTFSTGAHGALVEVDAQAGTVKIIKYVAAHDVGSVINPIIVEGQVQGGVAHGIGNALLERIAFDSEGQPLTSSLKDYLLPLSTDVNNIEVLLIESPSQKNPLGIKGVGEAGAVGVPAVLVAAVENALAQYGVRLSGFPVRPEELARWSVSSTRSNGQIQR